MKMKILPTRAGFAGLLLLAVLPFHTQAGLAYVNVGSDGLIYDSSTGLYWTQVGDLSSETFSWSDAQTWAAQLDYAGISAGNWVIPDADQLTSLYSQLYGTDHKYGSQVNFGPGPYDYASNVETVYWTDTTTTDFNFYYGYPGYDPDDTDLYSAWAVTTTAPVPEPSALALGGIGLLVAAGGRYRRQIGAGLHSR